MATTTTPNYRWHVRANGTDNMDQMLTNTGFQIAIRFARRKDMWVEEEKNPLMLDTCTEIANLLKDYAISKPCFLKIRTSKIKPERFGLLAINEREQCVTYLNLSLFCNCTGKWKPCKWWSESQINDFIETECFPHKDDRFERADEKQKAAMRQCTEWSVSYDNQIFRWANKIDQILGWIKENRIVCQCNSSATAKPRVRPVATKAAPSEDGWTTVPIKKRF